VWCNYSIFEGNERPDIEEGRAKHGDDKTYIGLYHAPLVGASTDIGYEFNEGNSLEIFDGCDMVLLGDIHKRSCFYLDEFKEIDESELDFYQKKGWVVDD
jgi:hypothetical protein